MSLESDPHFRESPQLRGCTQTCRQQSSGLPPCPPPSWGVALSKALPLAASRFPCLGREGAGDPARLRWRSWADGAHVRRVAGAVPGPRPPTWCPFSRRWASFRRSPESRSRQRRMACPEDLADQKTCRSQESEICSHDSNRISKDFLSSLFLEIGTNFL